MAKGDTTQSIAVAWEFNALRAPQATSALTHKKLTALTRMLKRTKIDTEAGMLSGISRKRSIRSRTYWFTEFCNSQCLSHFAAPFIVVRAETSVAESCMQRMHVRDHAEITNFANASLTIWQAEKERRQSRPCVAYPRASRRWGK